MGGTPRKTSLVRTGRSTIAHELALEIRNLKESERFSVPLPPDEAIWACREAASHLKRFNLKEVGEYRITAESKTLYPTQSFIHEIAVEPNADGQGSQIAIDSSTGGFGPRRRWLKEHLLRLRNETELIARRNAVDRNG